MKALVLPASGAPGFAAEVSRLAGTDVQACYACGKCSAGCPVSASMDYQPHQIIRLVQLDQKDEVLSASAFWLCASCVTCSVRCPREVKLAQVMDALREISRRSGVAAGQPRIAAFYGSFLDLVRSGGRLHELGMTAMYKLRSRDLFGDIDLGVKLMLRGKLKLIPGRIKGRHHVAGIFRRVREHEAGEGGKR
ncbi:MAG: 4Fe-4S dicluster domain-containing protein [Bacillota bacterium]|nr:4Fe-4S dicluster domain-containing protein [Bacillota bacterium]